MSSGTSFRLVRPARRALTLLASLVIAFTAVACQARDAGQLETLALGLAPLEQNTLIYVADQQGFFAQNNLKIVVKDYDSGVATVRALLKGEVDLAGASEFPFVSAAFRQESITIIATDDKFENDYLVGRRDRGIGKLADLKGKRIGLARQTITEFFLGRLLELQGIPFDQVTLVDLEPAEFVSAIAGGEVDALVAWQPYVHQIQEQVSGIVVLPAQSNQAVYGVLICRDDWRQQHPELVVRFLKSLRAAEDYVVRYPEQAKAVVQKRLGYDDGYMASIWDKHQFALSLDYSLIAAMTDEAHWMAKNRRGTPRPLPDFVNHVYVDGLEAVKPEAVNIVR